MPEPNSLFLDSDDLRTLTGYALPGWQCRWLKSHRWKFELSAAGKPVVLRAYAVSRLSDANPVNEPVMNLVAIRRRA